jgi:hypothetical protein
MLRGLLSFGFPFFIKVIIPGIVGAIIIIPLIASVGIKIGLDVGFLERSLPKMGLLFIGLALSIGFLLYFLEDIIYGIFEGYTLWPRWLRNRLTSRLNRRIKGKLEKTESTATDAIEQRSLWNWLLKFPLKKDREKTETEAILPTKLGNILWSYEDYPESRYRMEPTFYWPRLWLALDSESRKEISTIWAEADCLTYISFLLLCSSILYVLASILDFWNIPTLILGPIGKPVDNITICKIALTPGFFLVMGVVSLILCWFSYTLSLPFHVKNGNFFQAAFDLHRDKLEKMQLTVTGQLLDDGWPVTRAYLRHGLKKCHKCSEYFPSYKENCPRCKNR